MNKISSHNTLRIVQISRYQINEKRLGHICTCGPLTFLIAGHFHLTRSLDFKTWRRVYTGSQVRIAHWSGVLGHYPLLGSWAFHTGFISGGERISKPVSHGTTKMVGLADSVLKDFGDKSHLEGIQCLPQHGISIFCLHIALFGFNYGQDGNNRYTVTHVGWFTIEVTWRDEWKLVRYPLCLWPVLVGEGFLVSWVHPSNMYDLRVYSWKVRPWCDLGNPPTNLGYILIWVKWYVTGQTYCEMTHRSNKDQHGITPTKWGTQVSGVIWVE